MPLSDTTIRNAKPKAKPYRLADAKGLYLEVAPSGGKWWRLKYRIDGKEKRFSLGVYPDVGLADARERRDAARKLVAAGTDPSAARKTEKADRVAAAAKEVHTFERAAREWYEKRLIPDVSAAYADQVMRRLEGDVFPYIGNRPVGEIEPPDLLEVLRRVEARGAKETAHRLHQYCGQVFRYAIASTSGIIKRDPSADLRGALTKKGKVKHRAAVVDPKGMGALLRAVEGYQGAFATLCALRLAPLVFVRPGELRRAEWSEIDLDAATWDIPGPRMMMKVPHLVPLSRQAVTILQELHALTGSGRYVFPSIRTGARCMSENTVNAALRRLGYTGEEMTGHGFRAAARTILDEVLHFRVDFIEHQLAHAVRDPEGRAYNRTSHLAERHKMMQAWADYLDHLKRGGEVVPFPERVAK